MRRLTPDGHGPPKQPPKGPPWHTYALAGLGIFALATVLSMFTEQPSTELTYSDFKQAVRDGRVAEVTFDADRISGRLFAKEATGTSAGSGSQQPSRPASKSASDAAGGTGSEATADGGKPQQASAETNELDGRFATTKPQVNDPQLLDLLEQHHVQVAARSTGNDLWGRVLISLLPWVLLLGLFLYISYRMQQKLMGDGGKDGGIFGFGKSKAKRIQAQEVHVGLDDVAGLANAKADLAEIIDHLADPQRFRALGAKIPKGVLLIGPPGTGKTLLARAVAGEAGVPYFHMSGSEFVEMFVGVGASRVRDLFQQAKQAAPCVIFVDEIDAVGRSRGTGLGGGHDEREQTLNQILSEMDGFEPHENVVMLAATNRADVLDAALLRPGRFDRKVYLELPDRKARRAILEIHAKKIPLADDVDLGLIAGRTTGFSGADLENLVNEAALLAGRNRKQQVDMALFAQARDKIALGAEREQVIGDDERRLIAVHESGHALLAWLLPNADPLDKVTIIPRGQALGVTEQIPEEERHTYKQSYLRDRIGVMLGGRIAEQLVFGEVTTGAESDLEQATKLARRMVSRWGMSEVIGPVSFRRGQQPVFLGREMQEGPEDHGDSTAQRIDEEIQALIGGIERDARDLMHQHQAALECLAERLLEEEVLDREQIHQLLCDTAASNGKPLRAAAG
nr:ATP-dependent zinc metalloprotease FtsH [Thiohalocapsa sp.]